MQATISISICHIHNGTTMPAQHHCTSGIAPASLALPFFTKSLSASFFQLRALGYGHLVWPIWKRLIDWASICISVKAFFFFGILGLKRWVGTRSDFLIEKINFDKKNCGLFADIWVQSVRTVDLTNQTGFGPHFCRP